MRQLNIRKLWAALALCLALCLAVPAALPAPFLPGMAARAAAAVKLNRTRATIHNGKSVQLQLKNAAGKVSWSSSDRKVASVNGKGVVTGRKVGSATVTATCGGKRYACRVTVKPALVVKQKRLTAPTGTLLAVDCWYCIDGGSLSYRIGNPKLLLCQWADEWTDDNQRIKLYLVGVKAGSTTVKLTNDRTNDAVTVRVTVTGDTFPVMTPSATRVSLGVGKSRSVRFDVLDGGSLTYSIADESVVDCAWGKWNDNDVIPLKLTGKKAGTTVVTVTHDATRQKIKLHVTVK